MAAKAHTQAPVKHVPMKKTSKPATAAVIPPVENFPTSAPATRSAAKPAKKADKRENTFSKSRDIREDRGTRQMKSGVNSRSFPHTRQS